MKKIIIPIDFSRASNNAISYAVDLSNQYPVKQIILVVNVYVTEFEQLIPSADFIQYSMDKASELDSQLKIQFEQLKRTLLHKVSSRVRLSFILSKIPFLQSLRNIISNEQPDLMLIGSNHGVSGEESYIGNYLIKTARMSTIPALVVPELAHYQEIKRALVPFNMSNLPAVKLIRKISKLKEWPHPELLFLDVNNASDTSENANTDDGLKTAITQNLRGYTCHFFCSDEKDVLRGINHFSFTHELELIIALPGKHSFLYSLTHRSIIKALAKNNYKPVLILKNIK